MVIRMACGLRHDRPNACIYRPIFYTILVYILNFLLLKQLFRISSSLEFEVDFEIWLVATKMMDATLVLFFI